LFFVVANERGCLAGPVQTSVKKGVEESVALPCQLRVVRSSAIQDPWQID
jgi:hypothetical protein